MPRLNFWIGEKLKQKLQRYAELKEKATLSEAAREILDDFLDKELEKLERRVDEP